MPQNRDTPEIEHLSPIADAWEAATERAFVSSQLIRTPQYVSRCAEQLLILNELSKYQAIRALDEIKLFPNNGSIISIPSDLLSKNYNRAYIRAISRLIDMAVDQNIIERSSSNLYKRVTEWPTPIDTNIFLERAKISGIQMDLFNFVHKYGKALPDVINGVVHPAELLFQGGMLEAALGLYANAPAFVYCNDVAVSTIHGIVRNLNPGATLTVLEIGAGTGATTQAILPALGEHVSKYAFTDISPMFLNDAKNKFSSKSFIDYAILDIEDDEQSSKIGSFDIVIAAHVLHATVEIQKTLNNVRNTIANGGILILLEETEMQPFFSTTMGFQTGFDRFNDIGLRQHHPLLSSNAWEAELQRAGFRNTFSLPPVMGISPILAQVRRS